jgi:hypothetical protein
MIKTALFSLSGTHRPPFRGFAAAMALGAAMVAWQGTAHADTLTPGSRDNGQISAVAPGVKELGIESVLVLDYTSSNGVSQANLSTVSGLAFRYFLIENLALTLKADLLYRSTGTGVTAASSVGGIGTVGAMYLVRLGGGLFLNPGLGVGGFYTSDQAGVDPNVLRATTDGFAARVGAGLVYYAGSRFNLFARPEAVMLFGSSTPSASNPQPGGTAGTSTSTSSTSSTNIEGGFNVGISLVF